MHFCGNRNEWERGAHKTQPQRKEFHHRIVKEAQGENSHSMMPWGKASSAWGKAYDCL